VLAFVFDLPLFVFFALFVLLLPVDDVFVLRGARRRRAGAFVFVVFGRVLRKAPRTSSSCCAPTIMNPQTNAIAISGMTKILNFISLPFGDHHQNKKKY